LVAREKAQQIVPALLTAYGGVEAVEFIKKGRFYVLF